MIKIKIDSNIPVPRKWPLDDMKVGDSFKVPESVKRTAIAVYVSRYNKANDKKFVVRKTAEGELRCWRIA